MGTTRSELEELVIEYISDKVTDEPTTDCFLVHGLGMQYFEILEVIAELEKTLDVEIDDPVKFYNELTVGEFVSHLYKTYIVEEEEIAEDYDDDDCDVLTNAHGEPPMPLGMGDESILLTDEEKAEDEFDDLVEA